MNLGPWVCGGVAVGGGGLAYHFCYYSRILNFSTAEYSDRLGYRILAQIFLIQPHTQPLPLHMLLLT